MLIGDDDCFLRIERDDSADRYAPFRVEARLRLDDSAEFFAFHNLVVLSSGDEERAAFDEFANLRSQRFLIALSDEGSLELRRDARGHIDVLFSIACRRVGPHWKTSGDVHVEGEYALDFLRDFRRVVFGRQ